MVAMLPLSHLPLIFQQFRVRPRRDHNSPTVNVQNIPRPNQHCHQQLDRPALETSSLTNEAGAASENPAIVPT
jgi:hypothetical protein